MIFNAGKDQTLQIQRIRKYSWYGLISWTILICASLVITIIGHKTTLTDFAISTAKTTAEKDILFRHWASSFGGIYIPVTEKIPPNRYLTEVPDRDIKTPSGIELTLINPSYMTRLLYEFSQDNMKWGNTGHIISIKPINPVNTPDGWELRALRDFENGETSEFSEMMLIEGRPYLRYIKSFVTEQSCLECHAKQGYKEGDIRGGISITVPLQPLVDSVQGQIINSTIAHLMVWIGGIIATIAGARKLIRGAVEQNKAEKDLQEQTILLEREILDRKSAQESLYESEKKLLKQNDELLVTEEMLRVQIGEYELAERQLKVSNATLQTMFDVSPLPKMIVSRSGGFIIDINHTFSVAFNYSRNEIIGKTGIDLGIWKDAADRHDFINAVDAEHEVAGLTASLKRQDGEARSVRLYSASITYKDEPCLLVLIMDVTEQQKIEEELRHTQKMDVVGQLAGGVAHDFNNMLTAIIGSAELLERHLKDRPSEAKLLATINQAAGRSAELTAQLLAFSRKGSSQIVQVSLNKAVKSVVAMLERTIDKNITIEARLDASSDQVIGDPLQIQNALLNLGLNSRDAMTDGGIIVYSTSNVFVQSGGSSSNRRKLQPGQYIRIAVSDNGCGIKPEHLEHVFEPFFTTKEICKGAGLGLAAVYGTVAAHKGDVTVSSPPGSGAIFSILLPLASGAQTTDIFHIERSRGESILLVDDEPLILEMGQALLEDYGYNVYLAASGEEAMRIIEEEHEQISLVILDIVMPGMGGKVALKQIIANYPGTKVLISSGYSHESSVDDFIKMGARGFIHKPYKAPELLATVAGTIKSNS